MKLWLSKPRGFCAGVVRAIQTVERALELYGAPIYVKHEIVHNQHVINDLKQQGAIFIEDLSDVPEGARVIYSAHGVPPSVREEAKRRGLIEIDATCGLVTKVHSAVKRFVAKGYHILLIGHKKHVEVIGTAGEAPVGSLTIVQSKEEAEALSFPAGQKLFYVTQTTLSLDDVKEIAGVLQTKFPTIETIPSSSICYATTNRQMALRELIGMVDLVLVVGDPKSSNSNRLCEVGKQRSLPSYLIHDAYEIDPQWLQKVKQIGLTAGASTPEEVVQRCIDKLRSLGVRDVEEFFFTDEKTFFQLPL